VVGAAVEDAVEEDHFVAVFAHGDVHVLRVLQLVPEFGQLVVVRGEEGLGLDAVVDELGDGPGDADAVEGAGATADLVEDEEAVLAWRR
jgi:hypothetical protein